MSVSDGGVTSTVVNVIAYGAAIARRNRWVALLVPLALAFELHPRHIRWWMTNAETPPVYAWLAKTRPACVIELPVSWSETEAGYVLASVGAALVLYFKPAS